MDEKKIVGFQLDSITKHCIELKEQEALVLGEAFNLSKFIRNAIKTSVLGGLNFGSI